MKRKEITQIAIEVPKGTEISVPGDEPTSPEVASKANPYVIAEIKDRINKKQLKTNKGIWSPFPNFPIAHLTLAIIPKKQKNAINIKIEQTKIDTVSRSSTI